MPRSPVTVKAMATARRPGGTSDSHWRDDRARRASSDQPPSSDVVGGEGVGEDADGLH